MESLYSTVISTESGPKKIEVYCCDVTRFDEKIDILTTSAFEGDYAPTPRTVFRALHDIGISVQELSFAASKGAVVPKKETSRRAYLLFGVAVLL